MSNLHIISEDSFIVKQYIDKIDINDINDDVYTRDIVIKHCAIWNILKPDYCTMLHCVEQDNLLLKKCTINQLITIFNIARQHKFQSLIEACNRAFSIMFENDRPSSIKRLLKLTK